MEGAVPKAVDLTGQRFGRLTVEARGADVIRGARQVPFKRWWCACDCGGRKLVEMSNLRRPSGATVSCGCYRKELNRLPSRTAAARAAIAIRAQAKLLVGQRFSRLTVQGWSRRADGRGAWECACDCGQRAIVVDVAKVQRSIIKSCGCLREELLSSPSNPLITYAHARRIPEEQRPLRIRERKARNRRDLSNWYVRFTLRDTFLNAADIPAPLIAAKRAYLKVKRLLREAA